MNTAECLKPLLSLLDQADKDEILIRIQVDHLDGQDDHIVAELRALLAQEIASDKLVALETIASEIRRIEAAETDIYGILESLWYSKAKIARDLHALLAPGTVVESGHGGAISADEESRMVASIARI